MIGDYFINAAKCIFRRKSRNILTVSGIAIGIASVIVIGNISNIGASAVSREFDSLGLNGISISGSEKLSNITEDELQVIRNSDYSEKATPIVVTTGTASLKSKNTDVIVWGIDSSACDIISLDLMYGRFINIGDIKNFSNVCLVDKEFSQNLYGRDNIVGRRITIESNSSPESYTVIGVIKTGNGLLQNAMGSYIPNFIYVPYSTLQAGIGMSGFHQIAVKINEKYTAESAGKGIVEQLNRFSGKENGYISQNLANQKEALLNIMDIITVILTAIGCVSLVVSCLNIMTVMLTSVNERKKEIGIKKAVGATGSAILTEFLFESVILCIIGAFTGIILGSSIILIGSYIIKAEYSLDYGIMIYSVIFAVAAGIIFGIYPAGKAAKLNPINTLRFEQ